MIEAFAIIGMTFIVIAGVILFGFATYFACVLVSDGLEKLRIGLDLGHYDGRLCWDSGVSKRVKRLLGFRVAGRMFVGAIIYATEKENKE